MTDLSGKTIRNYQVKEQIGAGGYGAVYKASQQIGTTSRDVALKVILPRNAHDADFIRRFEVEAEIVARLEHPFIIPLYDYWREGDNIYLVMRYLHGGSLRDELVQGAIAPEQVADILNKVASALAKAHSAGIVHRDIKPDNILLDDENNAYLTDFGIAKSPNVDSESQPDAKGTLLYMPPEQLQGQEVSPQSDIYALGILLYELLAGQHPFHEASVGEVITKHMNEPLPDIRSVLPDLSGEVDDVIQTATQKEPSERYADVREMAGAFQAALRDELFHPLLEPLVNIPTAAPGTVHVFISYSRQDLDRVRRLTTDLRARGIHFWFDQLDLKPGTADWEEAIRVAVHQASSVLFMASPQARRSPYVRDELAVAQMAGVPMYPIWVEGEQWIDSVPLGKSHMQFIDVRDTAYESGVEQIVSLLGGEAVELQTSDTETVVDAPPVDLSQAPRNPYKGLRAFRAEDEADFFGRDALINDLLETIGDGTTPPRLLAILGASGSGKSSVVMAGLLPRLQQGAIDGSDNWRYLDPIVPGTHPIESLTITLARLLNRAQSDIRKDLLDRNKRGLHALTRELSDPPVILYIDQFEELFTLVDDEAERRQFIDLLTTAITEPNGVLTVMLSMRADFYDRPLQYPEFGDLLHSNHVPITPMTLADLYDVVQQPAQLADVQLAFEEGLVTELVYAVREEVAALPLLQFTLDQLFEQCEDRTLTRQAYEAMGGVQGALAQHAEATFNNLPSDQHKTLARALFLRLIEAGATEQDTTRRRATFTELTLPDMTDTRILQESATAFVNARLLVSDKNNDERTLEISHEALIREWVRLGAWLRDSRADLRLQKRLSADVAEWKRREQPTDMLYRGTILEDAETWARHNQPSRDEYAFLIESIRVNRAKRIEDARIASQVQNMQRVAKSLVGLIIVFSILGVTLGFFLFNIVSVSQEIQEAALVEYGFRVQEAIESDFRNAFNVANNFLNDVDNLEAVTNPIVVLEIRGASSESLEMENRAEDLFTARLISTGLFNSAWLLNLREVTMATAIDPDIGLIETSTIQDQSERILQAGRQLRERGDSPQGILALDTGQSQHVILLNPLFAEIEEGYTELVGYLVLDLNLNRVIVDNLAAQGGRMESYAYIIFPDGGTFLTTEDALRHNLVHINSVGANLSTSETTSGVEIYTVGVGNSSREVIGYHSAIYISNTRFSLVAELERASTLTLLFGS